MLTGLHVRNYKALKDVAIDLSASRLHALIGPNDTGKSSILEAIYALSMSTEKPASECFPGIWEKTELVWNHDLTERTVHITATLDAGDEYRYNVQFTFPLSDKTVTVQEDLQKAHNLLFDTRRSGRKETVVRTYMRHPEEAKQFANATEKDLHFIFSALHGVQVHRWDSRFLALPAVVDSKHRFQMEPGGFGLARCLDDILGFDRELFSKLETQFCNIFPQFKSIKLVTQSAYRSRETYSRDVPKLEQSEGKGLRFELRRGGAVLPASQVSDGILLVLAYLTILYTPDPPRLLLVEEPENGIHPRRLQEIVRILRDILERQETTQIIMTTHSPYLVDELKPEEVTLCTKQDDGAVRARQMSSIRQVREQMDLFHLGEIWTSTDDDELAASENAKKVEGESS